MRSPSTRRPNPGRCAPRRRKSLRTDEAALTGESVPADKTSDAVAPSATIGDRTGMAFSGTRVVSGRATGVVVGTGSDTELGRINRMLGAKNPLEKPGPDDARQLASCVRYWAGVQDLPVGPEKLADRR